MFALRNYTAADESKARVTSIRRRGQTQVYAVLCVVISFLHIFAAWCRAIRWDHAGIAVLTELGIAIAYLHIARHIHPDIHPAGKPADATEARPLVPRMQQRGWRSHRLRFGHRRLSCDAGGRKTEHQFDGRQPELRHVKQRSQRGAAAAPRYFDKSIPYTVYEAAEEAYFSEGNPNCGELPWADHEA